MMKTLKYIKPDLSVSENIAIIGSSGRLIYIDYGKEIDSFDDVVRFNRAPVESYERDVGSKTTLRVANNHVFANVDISDWSTGQPKNFIKNLRDTKILYIGPEYGVWLQRKKYTHESCDTYLFHYSKMHQIQEDVGFVTRGNLSVGVAFICICVASGIKPHLFGFDIEQDIKRTHYWEKHPGPGGVHKISKEKELLQHLLDSGKLVYYE